MNPQRLFPVLGSILLIGLLTGILGQRRELAARRAALARPVAETPNTPAPLPTSASLTDAESRELLTLRRDVGQLRRQRPQLDHLRRENARLRAALTPAETGSPNDGPAVPKNYLLASKASFLGLATPADTLESFLYAARHRDTNALLRVLTPESGSKMLERIEQLRQQGSGSIFDDFGWIPGLQIQSLKETPEGTAEAQLRIDPRDTVENQSMDLERINGEWRLRLF